MKWVTCYLALMVVISTATTAAAPQAFLFEHPPEPQPLPAPQAQPQAPAQAQAPPQPVPIVRPVGTSEVSVSEFMTVDIVAQNDYITNILMKLAIQSRRNIVPSPASERLVSANIYGVPFAEGLSGLLEPNGLGYVERGDFIFVYTAYELADMQAGDFATTAKIIHLDYLRAADARDYVLAMLSNQGSIEVTKDFPDGDKGGGAEAAAGAIGGQVQSDDDIYSPNEDEYDLRNAIIVHDLPERVERIEAFLREVDTRPAQVLLEATIISTSISEDNAFGIDFAVLGDENFIDFFDAPSRNNGLRLKDGVALDQGFVVSNPGNTGLGDATLRAGYVGNVGFFLRALDQVSDVTILSNPKVMTLNRQRTRVFVGERVGYFETTTVENQVNQTVKFLDVGIVLDVRPFVLRDGRVRLELSPKVSRVTFREVTGPDGITQQVPDEQVQSVTTNVLVPAGHTAVLGGLFREDTLRGRSQVPFFGDLPLLGPLFQGRDDSLAQTELIFLIKPTVLQDDAVIEAGLAGEGYGEDVRVGSRLGLLFWSRERQSARLNLEAERLLVDGHVKRARRRLRRSLGVFPQQPEVIRALERLDRKDLWIRDLSYVNQLIDEEYARMEAKQAQAGEEE